MARSITPKGNTIAYSAASTATGFQPMLTAAIFVGAADTFYKWFNSYKYDSNFNFASDIIKKGGFIVLNGLIGQIPILRNVSNIFFGIFIVIIALNSGGDIIQSLGKL